MGDHDFFALVQQFLLAFIFITTAITVNAARTVVTDIAVTADTATATRTTARTAATAVVAAAPRTVPRTAATAAVVISVIAVVGITAIAELSHPALLLHFPEPKLTLTAPVASTVFAVILCCLATSCRSKFLGK